MDGVDAEAAVEWLLESNEPAVRYLTRRDVLGEDVEPDAEELLSGPQVRGLLSGQEPNGGFGCHPYTKWSGAHWRLVSLVELGVPAGTPQALAAAETVLPWLTHKGHIASYVVIDGLARSHASMEGNAVAVCSLLGMAEDPRVESLARLLVEWQWPDGGWNCDKKASGRRSSFHESHAAAWGLHEYSRATGAAWAADAAQRTAELFLAHRIFRSLGSGEVIKKQWLALHYPPYWHYDVLQALLVLGRLGRLGDERADEALELLLRRQRPDGRWQPGGYWWNPPGSKTSAEVVDWGRGGPNELITLNALRVLRMADRLSA
jgi:hypothetical protein